MTTVCAIFIPPPARVGLLTRHPRAWHAAQYNALARLAHASGWKVQRYEAANGRGSGATMWIETDKPGSVPGKLPDPIQEYVRGEYGGDVWGAIRAVLTVVKAIISRIPGADAGAAVLDGVGVIVDAADSLDDGDERGHQPRPAPAPVGSPN